MDELLRNRFIELRSMLEKSNMDEDTKIKTKVILSDIKANYDSLDGGASNFKQQLELSTKSMMESYRRAYTELVGKFKNMEIQYNKNLQQLSNSIIECEQLNKQIKELNNVGNKDASILNHIEKVKEGNISFKDNIDMELIIKLYIQGYSAGNIVKELDKQGVTVARQTIVNRLSKVGLWGNRENWSISKLNTEELGYIKRHSIDIEKIVKNNL